MEFTAVLYGRKAKGGTGNGAGSGERKSGWQDNSQPLAQSTTRCVCDFGAFVRVQRLNWG